MTNESDDIQQQEDCALHSAGSTLQQIPKRRQTFQNTTQNLSATSLKLFALISNMHNVYRDFHSLRISYLTRSQKGKATTHQTPFHSLAVESMLNRAEVIDPTPRACEKVKEQ
jgi:hypothetical protein